MRKALTAALALLLVATAFAGCMRNEGPGDATSSVPPVTAQSYRIRDDLTLEELYNRIAADYPDGIVAMPGRIDDAILTDQFGLAPEDYEEFYGEQSVSLTNSDHLIIIKAKPGRAEAVKAALEARKDELVDEFEKYPVNGSYERAKSAVVYTRGDYVILMMVGAVPEESGSIQEGFEEQVEKIRRAFENMFELR